MKAEGDEVQSKNGTWVLGKAIGGGTEGVIFELTSAPNGIDCSKFVVKILNDATMSKEQKLDADARLYRLRELCAEDVELRKRMTLPLDLLTSDFGYIMYKAIGYESLTNYLNPPSRDCFENWYMNKDLKKRYLALELLFNTLRLVHISGLVFTDLSPNNIMIKSDENGLVFIDTDNLRIRDRPCLSVIGTPGYMAPELYRASVPKKVGGIDVPVGTLSDQMMPTADSDIFSAAVIAFQLLTLRHPFIGDAIEDGSADDEEKALRIETDYILKKGGNNQSTRGFFRNSQTYLHRIISNDMFSLFERTFVTGKDDSLLRPTAEEYLEVVQKTLDRIVTCPECGFQIVFSPSANNLCVKCNKPQTRKVEVLCGVFFNGMTRADCINAINPDADWKLNEIASEKKGEGNKLPLLSFMVVDEGTPRVLLGRHLEENDDRFKVFATIEVSDYDKGLLIVRTSNKMRERFPKAHIIDDSNNGNQNLLTNNKVVSINQWIVLNEERLGAVQSSLMIWFKRYDGGNNQVIKTS